MATDSIWARFIFPLKGNLVTCSVTVQHINSGENKICCVNIRGIHGFRVHRGFLGSDFLQHMPPRNSIRRCMVYIRTPVGMIFPRPFRRCIPIIQVTPLEGRSERLAKGDEVLAVYVDTTSFYHATIAIPPRGRGAQIVSQRVLVGLRRRATPRRCIHINKCFYDGAWRANVII